MCVCVCVCVCGNFTNMVRTVLNKSWKQHPTKWQLYNHSPPISQTINIRPSRHAGDCERSKDKDKLINDILLRTSLQGSGSFGRLLRTHIYQISGHWMQARMTTQCDIR